MDNFLELLAKNYGILGVILAGVVAYLLRMETVFWKEREDFKARLQSNHENFTALMKERLVEQQQLVRDLTETLDKMQERIRLAEMEFVKLQETVLPRLEQIQLYQQGNGQNKGLPN